MATDLVGNEKLQRFIQLLSDLNHETAEVFSSGKTEIFHKMNDKKLKTLKNHNLKTKIFIIKIQ